MERAGGWCWEGGRGRKGRDCGAGERRATVHCHPGHPCAQPYCLLGYRHFLHSAPYAHLRPFSFCSCLLLDRIQISSVGGQSCQWHVFVSLEPSLRRTCPWVSVRLNQESRLSSCIMALGTVSVLTREVALPFLHSSASLQDPQFFFLCR